MDVALLIAPFSAAAALFASGGVFLWARWRLLDALRASNERAERTRLGKAEIELAELRELYTHLLDSHKKLRSRIDRRAANAKHAANGIDDDIPDWRTDPTAARKALERKHGLPSLD